MNEPAFALRPIRSFVIRAGRITPAQERALLQLSNKYTIPFDKNSKDVVSLLHRSLSFERVILDIGFGTGDVTVQLAAASPETLFLGCEVHPPGVGALLKRIEIHQLKNIRIIMHDAVEVLHTMIADETLDGIHLFFPDPWPKKRHHKRRIVQPDFVRCAARKLKIGGYFHPATDWQPYADHMLEVLSAEPLLENTAEDFAPRPQSRPLTRFEQRGLKLGHMVRDLHFIRRAVS